ncbi:MAG: GNAT family N-acetyltransferase [Candidatus Mariimomonas ferrooxydans]
MEGWGIGTRLLRDGLKELTNLRPDTGLILLEVRESNTPAIKLYEKSGFKTIGKRAGYYHKPNEDAVIMELKTRKKL